MSDTVIHTASAPFEAARRVDSLPLGHSARALHGHSFMARIRAELPAGWEPFRGAGVEALETALKQAVAPLNYAYLNDQLASPTDENLARWLREHLALPGLGSIGVMSTRDQGADMDGAGHVHIWRRFRFEAAHQLPNVPVGHQCGRMHGHGFEVILHADQDLAEGEDFGVDFERLAALWAPLQAELDHACLNAIPGLENPTSEMLAGWIWRRLKEQLAELSWVTVYETATAGCHYDGRHYRIWKERRFESALKLAMAPESDRRSRLHGHSYLLRLHLTAPLDSVMGWTVDYGDVKSRFEPVYRELDHHRLDALEGLAQADCVSLLRWMRTRMQGRLPELDRIDLYEKPGCGALLSWGELGPALPG